MKYRNIVKVINAIKQEIPNDWKDINGFLCGLDDVIDSSKYRAPEAYYVNYEQLSMVLGSCLGAPTTDWKMRIAEIFADKTKIKGMDYYERG